MKKIIIVVMIILALNFSSISIAQPSQPITVWGFLYQNSESFGEVDVYAKNMETGKIMRNTSDGVTADYGYQIRLEKIEGQLNGGDQIKIYADRTIDNYTYHAEVTFTLAYDMASSGGIIRRDLYFPPHESGSNGGNGGNGGSGGTGGGETTERTNNLFNVYGIVKDSKGNKTGNVNVTIQNIMTNDVKTVKITSNGNYTCNIGQLTQGWKVGDRISVNATYKEGYEKEYGKAPSFYIYAGTDEKERNIEMVVVGDENYIPNDDEELPITYDGLLQLYYKRLDEIDKGLQTIDEQKTTINQLIGLLNESYTEEEVDALINDAISNCNKGNECDNTLVIILFFIVIILILYLLYDKGILPIGKNKYVEEKSNNVIPVKRKYR